MIGFGPSLWSRKKGDTEYGIKAIPFGGYIRMIGMFPPGPDGKVKASSTGRLTAMIEDARSQAQEEVLTPEDEKRTFYRLSVPKGHRHDGWAGDEPILAFILFHDRPGWLRHSSTSLTVSEVTACTPSISNGTVTTGCVNGAPASPAAAAGLKPGDVLTSFNGTPMGSWDQFSQAIRQSPAGPATIGLIRNGQPMTVTADIQVVDRPVVVDGQPTKEIAPQGFPRDEPRHRARAATVERGSGPDVGLVDPDCAGVGGDSGEAGGCCAGGLWGEERDPNGPIGVVGVTRISGDVAAAEVPANFKVVQFLGMVASLNLLVPLQPHTVVAA